MRALKEKVKLYMTFGQWATEEEGGGTERWELAQWRGQDLLVVI